MTFSDDLISAAAGLDSGGDSSSSATSSSSSSSNKTKDESNDDAACSEPTEKKSRFHQFRAAIWDAWTTVHEKAPFLPPLITLLVGYRWGMLTSSSSSPIANQTPDSGMNIVRSPQGSKPSMQQVWMQAALAALIVREVWNTIPLWLKRQIPGLRRRYIKPKAKVRFNNRDVAATDSTTPDTTKSTTTNHPHHHDDEDHDLSSLPTLLGKLQQLFATTEQLVKSELTPSEVRTAFLIMIQLLGQFKQQHPAERDRRYEESGTVATLSELEGLDEAFEYADWAYDELPHDQELKQVMALHNWTVLRHDKVALPGSVAHYIAISKQRKLVLIGIKGTSSFEDVLTDACGNAVAYTLSRPFLPDNNHVSAPVELRCHEGILRAAVRLAQDVELLLEELVLPTGYNILVTGHSLGAGVACILGILLRSRFPQLMEQREGRDRLKVLAFASPAVLDLDSALACAPFITTIVNNADLVPRASLSNLVITMHFLKTVYRKLEEKGLAPKDFNSTAAFLKKIAQGHDGQLMMTPQEMRQGWEESCKLVGLRDPNHLYVPGRVIHMYDLWSKPNYGAKREDKDKSKVVVPPEEHDNDPLSLQLPLDPLLRPAERFHITDGASDALRVIEFDPRMISDHLSQAYRSSIRTLLASSSSSSPSSSSSTTEQSMMTPATGE